MQRPSPGSQTGLRSLISVACLALLALLAACPEKKPSPRRDAAPPRQAEAAPPAPVFEHCARLADPPEGSPKKLRIAGTTVLQRGFRLAPTRRAALRGGQRLSLGVLADPKEALEGTLANLRQLRSIFLGARVHAIVVLGGLDRTFEGTRKLLRALAGSTPLLVLPGARCSRSGFQAAVRELGRKAVDLSLVRLVELPGATLASVPGYFLPHHLLAGEQGCSYSPAEIEALSKPLAAAPAPRVLLAHGPPRGAGGSAVDRAFGAVNIGDPALARLMKSARARFGLFAHVHESAGHATTLDGRPVAEGEWSKSLLLNVGSADAVPHEDLSGKWSRGSAALFEIRAGRARYRMFWLRGQPARSLGTAPAPPAPREPQR